MTREEAIEQLKEIPIGYEVSDDYMKTIYEAIDMAIKALGQEPCNTDTCKVAKAYMNEWDKPNNSDGISRQAVLDKKELVELEDGQSFYCISPEDVETLPSVTPQPKAGHWIMPVQDDGMSEPICYQVRCSECGFDLDPQTWHMELHQYGADKYCPNCGARMEDKE